MKFTKICLLMLIFAVSSVNVLFAATSEEFSDMLRRANNGDVNAQFEVGYMYDNGNGVDRNYVKAREWYEKAAKRGHPSAQNNLGVLYDDGKGGRQDYVKAREWYEKAAAQNNGHAFDNLGMLYQNGEGVDVDYKKAFEYFTKGAEHGIARSMNQLGWLYEHGLGLKVDYSEALKWYTMGADNGNSASMNNLARMYENGIGVRKDTNKAIAFYRQSASKGNKKAQTELDRLTAAQKTPKPAKTAANQKTQPKFSANQNNIITPKNTGPLFPKSKGSRPRMAVLDFEDKSEERKANPDAIMNMMVTELHKAGGFTLLERERINDISKEINLGHSGLVDISTAVKIGKLKGAQYVMTGAITLYYYSEKASGFVFPILGAETKAKTAYVVIDIRIIDVETGEIVYAYDKTGQSTQKTQKASAIIVKDSERMIGGLLDTATRDSVKKHVSAITNLLL